MSTFDSTFDATFTAEKVSITADVTLLGSAGNFSADVNVTINSSVTLNGTPGRLRIEQAEITRDASIILAGQPGSFTVTGTNPIAGSASISELKDSINVTVDLVAPAEISILRARGARVSSQLIATTKNE